MRSRETLGTDQGRGGSIEYQSVGIRNSRFRAVLPRGAQAGEQRLREVAMKGGFTRFRRAAETPFNLVLEVRSQRSWNGQVLLWLVETIISRQQRKLRTAQARKVIGLSIPFGHSKSKRK